MRAELGRLVPFLVVFYFTAHCSTAAEPENDAGGDGGDVRDGDTDSDAEVEDLEALRELFFSLQVHRIDVVLDEDAVDDLTQRPNRYTHASVTIDGELFEDVAMRLKGGAGSFVAFDEDYSPHATWFGYPGKSAFILNLDRFVDDQALFGIEKLTLNNLAQDPSGIRELLAYALFREGGVPAARTTHALVTFNGEPRGLYVVLESPDNSEFLERHYSDDNGNMYEGEYGCDLREEWIEEYDQDNGDDDTLDDLFDLVDALDDLEDDDVPVERFEELIDLDEYLAFAVTELFTGHWDGYAYSANNYLIHHDQTEGSWTFLPWGLDQTFEEQLEPHAGVMQERHEFGWWGGRIHELCMMSDECRDRLYDAFEAILDRVDEMDLAGLAERARELIEPLILEEAALFGETEESLATFERTEEYIAERREQIEAWLPCLAGESVDHDGDGFDGCMEDCDDRDPEVHPGAEERCNFLDDDCNGELDDREGCPECLDEPWPWDTSLSFCIVARTWEEARQVCLDKGMDLVSIHEEETWWFVTFFMLEDLRIGESWLGLNDQELEGEFNWSDGSPVDFVEWGYRQPNPHGEDADCVLNTPEGWVNVECEERAPFVCAGGGD